MSRGEASRIATRGDGDDALWHARALALALRHHARGARHASRPPACTARLADGRLELWLASQAPDAGAARGGKGGRAVGCDVVLYPMPAGGSFDRRLEHDHAIEAAVIAAEVGASGAADLVALAGA